MKRRFVVYFAMSIMTALAGSLNLTMSFAWVCMTADPQNGTHTIAATSYRQLNWTASEQQYVFAANGIGLFFAVPCGWFVGKYGSRVSGTLALGSSALATLLIPVSASTSFVIVVILRIVVGAATSMFNSIAFNVCSWWTPRDETGLALAIAQVGVQVGRLTQNLIGGAECETIGWQWVFYIAGIAGVAYAALWGLLYRDEPQEVKFITSGEADLIIVTRVRRQRTHGKVPWLKILGNLPVWSCIVCAIGLAVIQRGIMQFVPTYFSDELHLASAANGYLSALPIVMQILGQACSGPLSDVKVGTTIMRMKVLNLLSFGGAGFCCLGLTFVTSGTPTAVPIVLFCAALFCSTLNTGGSIKSNLFIAAEYSAVVASLMSLGGGIGATAMPFIVDTLTADKTFEGWSKVFYIVMGICFFSTVVFLIFGSDKKQPFAHDPVKAIQSYGTIKANEVQEQVP